jgi:hypothetical protein
MAEDALMRNFIKNYKDDSNKELFNKVSITCHDFESTVYINLFEIPLRKLDTKCHHKDFGATVEVLITEFNMIKLGL